MTGILWLGAQYVLDGTMSGGTLGQFILYAVLCATSIGALSEVVGRGPIGSWCDRASGQRFCRSNLSFCHRLFRKSLPQPPQGHIAFDNVTFQYPTRPEISALSGFSLPVTPGETVALVGASGAGKSTVFQLLSRFMTRKTGASALMGLSCRT